MIVPDMPLFLGWTLSFVSAWEVCFATVEEFSAFNYVFLCAGVMLAILSKYSGVLGAFSALMCVGVWAPQNRRRKGVLYVVLGGVGAALPILWWNAHHEWASILYQIKERHGDAHISALRYLRFWLIELVLAGPALVLFGIGVLRRWVGRRAARVESYVMLWVLPGAAIFFSQPLWSDFKPHWALIVWWPLALALAWSIAKNGMGRLGRVHLGYGLSVIAFVLLACHIPVGGWVMSKLRSGPLDPRLDVTNDLYGWSDLRSFLAEKGALGVPILGSRYQTAGQAAFAMSGDERVTLLPRDLKAMDEWADLGVSIGQGPAWPKLTTTILFVTDNRYDAGPEYPGANCRKEWTLEKARAGFLAKTITIWKCVP
jgi:hypothetical protein